MTTSVIATAYGDASVLELVEEPTPTPGPDQALVSLRAAAVNPADWKAYQGVFGDNPANLPLRLGYEGSGVVTAVGNDVEGVAVGDEVIVFPTSGTYATDVVVPIGSLTPKPANLSWSEAAGLLLTGATATHALTVTSVADGDTVLIHGASGGVGQTAIQLAKLRGARVIATASPRNHELIRSLGAEPVAYGDGLLERVQALAPSVDAALDLAGTDEALEVSLALVADRGRIVTIANFGSSRGTGIHLIGGGPGADPGTEIRSAARAEIAHLAGEGKLAVTVAAEFPLSEVAAAHGFLQRGAGSGKVVLIP